MHLLSIQVQPDLAPSLDMTRLTAAFEAVAANKELVIEHNFESGNDEGPYFNFTFSTRQIAALWWQIRKSIFDSAEFRQDLSNSAQAACTGKAGWDDYLQLFHFDPDEPLDEPPAP